MNSSLQTILCLALALCAIHLFPSCSQSKNLEIQAGKVYNIKLGNIVKIKEIHMMSDKDDGAFASMANTATSAIAPGILATGATRIATEAGSLMDGKFEADKMLRIRIKLKDSGDLVEVIQEATPQIRFHIGQEVVITQNGIPGNAWPE